LHKQGIFCFSENQACLSFTKNKKDLMSAAIQGFSFESHQNRSPKVILLPRQI
jgi:hypothetical protein